MKQKPSDTTKDKNIIQCFNEFKNDLLNCLNTTQELFNNTFDKYNLFIATNEQYINNLKDHQLPKTNIEKIEQKIAIATQDIYERINNLGYCLFSKTEDIADDNLIAEKFKFYFFSESRFISQ